MMSGLLNIALPTPSSQIWIPSTDIQGFTNLHLCWSAFVDQTGNGLISNGALTIGILPFKKINMEIGIDYRDFSGNHQYPIYCNAKIGTPENAFFKHMPALAIGGYDIGFNKGLTKYDLFYGLIAKTIGKLGRLSAGGYYAIGDTLLMLDKNKKKEPSGLLISWDRIISEISNKLWVATDYQSGTNCYGTFSFGAGWRFAPNVCTIFGYNIFNNSAQNPTFTILLNFDTF